MGLRSTLTSVVSSVKEPPVKEPPVLQVVLAACKTLEMGIGRIRRSGVIRAFFSSDSRRWCVPGGELLTKEVGWEEDEAQADDEADDELNEPNCTFPTLGETRGLASSSLSFLAPPSVSPVTLLLLFFVKQ